MDKKQAYHKPVLRKVQLEVTTSVLATCNTTTNLTPKNIPTPGAGCSANMCYTRT
jgi:hypothetical protein